MAFHGLVNTMGMSCTNIDAMNKVGVATSDIDNGTLVTIGKMKQATDGTVISYHYELTPATANAEHVLLVASPEVGRTLEMQVHNDRRYFYNVAGDPVDVKDILAQVDTFEVDAVAFGGTFPVAADIGKFVSPDANGKYKVGTTAAPATGAYFKVEGFGSITCGQDEVKTVILRCIKN